MVVKMGRRPQFGGALLLLTALAACGTTRALSPERAIVSVGAKQVTIAAPRGFCVDPASLRMLPDGVFLLLTDCAPPNDGRKAAPNAAMTVHLSQGALFLPKEDRLDTLTRLADFLQSKSGRQILSRDGNAAEVSAEGSAIRNDALFIYVSDSGGPRIPGASRNYWRGFTQVAGGMASLIVYGFDAVPLSKSQGLAIANALVVALAEANPQPDIAR